MITLPHFMPLVFTNPDIPVNGGTFRPIDINIQKTVFQRPSSWPFVLAIRNNPSTCDTVLKVGQFIRQSMCSQGI